MSSESPPLVIAGDHRPVEDAEDTELQAVLEGLADPDCRRDLHAVAEVALTARECARACDVPLSTTYRKLELLTDAGLVEEQLRLRRDGKHASEYRRRFDEVCVSVDGEGDFAVAVSPRADSRAP